MILWMRTRRIWLLLIVLAGLAATAVGVGHRTITLPVFFGRGGGSVALLTFLPVGWAVGVADSWASIRQAVEVRPSRRLVGVDVGGFVIFNGLAATAFTPLTGATGPRLSGTGAALVVSGLAATVTLRRGSATGALAVALLAVVTITYATTAPWARYVRVLQPDGDLRWSLACGVTLLTVATLMVATNRVAYRIERDESLE